MFVVLPQADDTGNSIFTVLEKQQDLAAGLRKVRNCAINFGELSPDLRVLLKDLRCVLGWRCLNVHAASLISDKRFT